jgi:hypothetical protein
MIGDAERHRWRPLQCLMRAAEIVELKEAAN